MSHPMRNDNYKIIMPHWPEPVWGELPGTPLERINRLLQALDNPQNKLPPVIHVAGTNGKGSTIAMLRSILEAAGLKVHAYTSPHIKDFRERIIISGQVISPKALECVLERCRIANEEQPISFFEGTTAAAFLAFSETPADILLLETGMGGIYDPTNVIDNPRLSIITTISFDHMEYLGSKLEEIAQHKAGIIKPNSPTIISFQPPNISTQLEQYAEKINSAPMVYSKHWIVQRSCDGLIYADAYGQVEFPKPALKGAHQLINAGNVIAAISAMEELEISAEQIAAGLRWVQWPGRLEQLNDGVFCNILPAEWELWFDGGHNMAAGHMLAVQAEEWNKEDMAQYSYSLPLYVIFGTTRGKQAAAMLQPITSYARNIFAVPVQAEPKCYTPQEIVDQAADMDILVQPTDSVEDAVEDILSRESGAARILIFGSLYLRLEVATD